MVAIRHPLAVASHTAPVSLLVLSLAPIPALIRAPVLARPCALIRTIGRIGTSIGLVTTTADLLVMKEPATMTALASIKSEVDIASARVTRNRPGMTILMTTAGSEFPSTGVLTRQSITIPEVLYLKLTLDTHRIRCLDTSRSHHRRRLLDSSQAIACRPFHPHPHPHQASRFKEELSRRPHRRTIRVNFRAHIRTLEATTTTPTNSEVAIPITRTLADMADEVVVTSEAATREDSVVEVVAATKHKGKVVAATRVRAKDAAAIKVKGKVVAATRARVKDAAATRVKDAAVIKHKDKDAAKAGIEPYQTRWCTTQGVFRRVQSVRLALGQKKKSIELSLHIGV